MPPLFDKIEAMLIKVFLILLGLSVFWQLLTVSPKCAESLVLLNRLEGDLYKFGN